MSVTQMAVISVIALPYCLCNFSAEIMWLIF